MIMIYYACLIMTIPFVTSEILYIDAKRYLQKEENKQTDDSSPLSLSSLFSQSDNFQCIVDGNCESSENSDESSNKESAKKIYYGPRFQKVHLALPRRAPQEVGFTEKILLNNRGMTIKTLSNSPQVFEISNFLSVNETELMIELAQYKSMKKVNVKKSVILLPKEIDRKIFDKWDEDFDGHLSFNEVVNILELNPLLLSLEDIKEVIKESNLDEDSDEYISYGELSHGGFERFKETLLKREEARKMFQVKDIHETWIWHDEDELLAYEDLLQDFHQRVNQVSGIPTELIEETEPLQVRAYGNQASSPCQQDSMSIDKNKKCCVYGGTNCRMCRYATILMFLNDVEEGGELVFPLADNKTFSWEVKADPQ